MDKWEFSQEEAARGHRIVWAWALGRPPGKVIAAILERQVIEKILTHLGLDPQPPPGGRAREAGHDFAT